MNEKSKKTDLFRFVTTRSPQVISTSRIDLGFIYHPDEANSYFLTDLVGVADIDSGRSILASKKDTYTPNYNTQELKELDAVFWSFSDWLAKNKTNLTRAKVDANIAALPSASVILEIWDDLFYDILSRENPNVRETCLQLIIAINFAQKYSLYSTAGSTDEAILAKEKEHLERLANAKVVLSHFFSIKKNTDQAPIPISKRISHKRHEALHKARISSLCAEQLKSIKSELYQLDYNYKKDYETAHEAALNNYKSQVKQTVNNFISQNPDLVSGATINVTKEIKSIDVAKNNTKEIIKTLTQSETDLEHIIPSNLVEQFTFSYDKPLSKQYAQSQISNVALGYIQNNLLERSSVTTAINKINSEITKCKKLAYKAFKKKPKEFLFNGVPVKVSNLDLKDVSISFKEVISETDGSVSYALYFSMDAGFENAYIRSGTYTINLDGVDYTTTSFELKSNHVETIFGLLFDDASITSLPENKVVTFTANVELNNGKQYNISLEGLTNNECISGSAIPSKSAISNPDLHYGVNTIGVADYRKVEQELCCYLPGEVAHIENVMAREYMEKTTRSLTRTQTSTTSKSQQESEESLDTSSTNRNEMSTEISSVIDEEKSTNIGFNASAQGKISSKFSFNSGVNGDFSTGKSTSDSNSNAKTFAEDLTRRALERITQKISSKRSSTLLKEYEERESHGFDNRAGDQHVTGVYRWIDKVYKNRIINYGKRLIYEFMIPEPSRFYKEALIIKAEESKPIPKVQSNNEEELLIKPSHPSTLDIANAGSINRDNFEAFAAEYGIDVTAPPERYSNTSTAFSEGIGTGDKEMAFKYDNLNVPQDYECYNIQGQVDCSVMSTTQEYGFVKCAVGGRSFGSGYGDQKTWRKTIAIYQNVDGLEGLIPISVSCFKTTGFAGSIIAKCQLKSAVYEQWQQEVYGQIISAYETQMEAYKRAEQLAKEEEEAKKAAELATSSAPKEKKMVTNSKFNEQRVRTELKRLCIEMLTQPFNIEVGKDFYQNGAEDIPEIKLGSNLDIYASYVKFFEQAFDWDLMAEKFYPYYWAHRSDWIQLFQTQDGLDYSYQAFLQSGMGRIVVPVRQGFEDAVAHFMTTGEIWNGSGIVIDTTDKLYLSIVDETTHVEGSLEGQEWETIVPTTLRVLQGKSVMLNEEGLPCCETDPSNTLLPDTTILNAETPTDPPA